MTYSFGTEPVAPVESSPETSRWYKLTRDVIAWLNATYPNDPGVRSMVTKAALIPVFMGISASSDDMYWVSDTSQGNMGGDYSAPVPASAPVMTYAQVLTFLTPEAVRRAPAPIVKPVFHPVAVAPDRTWLYIGLTALGTTALVGVGLLLFRKKPTPAPAPARLAANRRRTSLRRNSGQRAAQNEAQIKYLLGEDIGRAGLTEEDEAAVESRLFVLGQQMSEAKSRLRRFGVRAIGNAQHLVDEFEQRGGWRSYPRGVLFTVAREHGGTGVPQEFLEEEFGWSQLDPETRAALQAMIEIAGIDAQGYLLAEDATSANADADEAERIAEALSQGPLVSSVGEAYEGSVWNRLQEATGRASSAKYHRGSVLEQLGERIEANGSVAYAIPERRAYPITTAQDAYHATQRLKQGRVKSEEDAKRIIRAIWLRHPQVWREHIAGYPVSQIMASKRKGLAARRRRTSRR